MSGTQFESLITCPVCRHRGRLTTPAGSRPEVAWCPVCGAKLTPEPGTCCVACAYGTAPCPPTQREQHSEQERHR